MTGRGGALLKKACFLIFLVGGAAQARVAAAAVVLEGIRWQQPKTDRRGPTQSYEDLNNWTLPAQRKSSFALRVLVSIRNGSEFPDEAVLLRYALSARFGRGEGKEGVWAPPFVLDERRVPKIRARETRAVPIAFARAVLGAYLTKMERAGFKPDALRIQVMIEPRPREGSLEGRIMEAALPMVWERSAAGVQP